MVIRKLGRRVMKKSILSLISAIFIFIFSGCESGGYITVSDGYPVEIKYTLYPGVNEYITQYSKEREILIIKDKNDFERIYAYYNPTEEIPDIDFDFYEVIAIIEGVKPTGGYFIDLKKIVEYEDYILVETVFKEPGENCIVPQVLTQPFIFIKIKNSDKTVKLKELKEIYSCSF